MEDEGSKRARIKDVINAKCSSHIIESFFQRIPLPYPITALIISAAIYLGYIFFYYAIDSTLIASAHLVAISMGILVGFQMAAISYLLGLMREIITSLDELNTNNERHICSIIGDRLLKSPWRYVLLICITAPFYIIDWIHPSHSLYGYFFWFDSHYETLWAKAFDIFINVLGLLALVLLSTIIWIIGVIIYIIYYGSNVCREEHPHEADSQSTKIKMDSIRSLLTRSFVIVLISISLAIFSYVNPDEFYSTETLMLLAILFSAGILVIFGRDITNQILTSRITFELDKINQKSREQIDRLLNISSDGCDEDKGCKVSCISEMLDVLHKQREQLESIYPVGYNFRHVAALAVTSIGSFLIPIAAGMIKMILEKNPQVISQLNSTVIEYAYNISI
jgi:hypothetical protein